MSIPATFPHIARAACGLLLAAFLATPAPALADETPAAVPAGAARWSLGLRHGPLKIIMVPDGAGRETSYHYMLLTVENKTAHPRPWRPHVVGRTDTGKTYIAGGFPRALERIRDREGIDSLVAIEESAAKAGPGGAKVEFTKIPAGGTLATVAIFGPLDPLYDYVRIDVEGLVNPFTTLRVLRYGEGDAAKKVVVEAAYADRNAKVMEELSKEAGGGELPKPVVEYHEVVEKRAWRMEYKRLGDEFRADDDPIQFIREGWEILGDPKMVRVIAGTGG